MRCKHYLFLSITSVFLSGCFENLSVGVSREGTGNGKPKEDLQFGFDGPLTREYLIQLSKPASDVCNGLKRTLKFIHPIQFTEINQPTDIVIQSSDQIENQIVAQLTWENTSSLPVQVTRPVCYLPFFLEQSDSLLYPLDQRCDSETSSVIEKEVIEIYNFNYSFRQTSTGKLTDSPNTFLFQSGQNSEKCEPLVLEYKISNIE